MTKGRTKVDRTDLRFETLVQAVGGPVPPMVPSEQVAILKLAVRPISVAEIAADLHLVVGVVQVLINDLLEEDLLGVLAELGGNRTETGVCWPSRCRKHHRSAGSYC